MGRTNKILALILAGLVIATLFAVVQQRQPVGDTTLSSNGTSPTKTSSFEAKTNSEGAVTLEVTPVVLKSGESPSFKVSLNTHSVDLGFNVEDAASLTDDQGNTIGSPKWTGSTPGGHHRNGELDFGQPLDQNAKSVTLTFKNIAGVSDRAFTWNLP